MRWAVASASRSGGNPLLLTELLPDVATAPRVLLSTVLMTPVMTYLVLPWLTGRLGWWLQQTQRVHLTVGPGRR